MEKGLTRPLVQLLSSMMIQKVQDGMKFLISGRMKFSKMKSIAKKVSSQFHQSLDQKV